MKVLLRSLLLYCSAVSLLLTSRTAQATSSNEAMVLVSGTFEVSSNENEDFEFDRAEPGSVVCTYGEDLESESVAIVEAQGHFQVACASGKASVITVLDTNSVPLCAIQNTDSKQVVFESDTELGLLKCESSKAISRVQEDLVWTGDLVAVHRGSYEDSRTAERIARAVPGEHEKKVDEPFHFIFDVVEKQFVSKDVYDFGVSRAGRFVDLASSTSGDKLDEGVKHPKFEDKVPRCRPRDPPFSAIDSG